MKKIAYLYSFIIGVVSALVLVGCGTCARQTSYFSAVHPETKTRNYFRVKVSAETTSGKGAWQTGWYSRNALDQIFSEITTNGTRVVDKMIDLHEDTLLTLVSNYNEALIRGARQTTNNFDEARRYQDAVFELNAMAGLIYSAGATPKDAAENAGKRFVYSFTADPTLLEQMVANALETEKIAATLSTLVTGNTELARQQRSLDQQLQLSLSLNKAFAARIDQALVRSTNILADLSAMTPEGKIAAVETLKIYLTNAMAQ